jgi:hypothetical protein
MPSNGVFKYFDIGESVWATAPDRNVRISSAERTSSYLDPSGNIREAPSGKIFIFLTVTCQNIGSIPLSTASVDFFLTDSEGLMYKDQTYADYPIRKPYPNASISPGITVTGKILRVVPISASGLEISYLLDPASTPPVIAKWKLP